MSEPDPRPTSRGTLLDVLLELQKLDAEDMHRLGQQVALLQEQTRARQPRFLGVLPTSVVRHFQGRQREITALQTALGDRHTRLIVISGRAGLGKTTLIARVLRDLDETSANPVAQLSLASPERGHADRVLDLLERRFAPTALPDAAVPDTAAHRIAQIAAHGDLARALIVLDGLEAILGEDNRISAAHRDVEHLLAACLDRADGPRLLVTTRRMLILPPWLEGRIAGWRLDVPLDRGLEPDESVAMLRALDVDGRLGMRDAPAERLLDVAHRCQHFPRTLEALAGVLRQRRTDTLQTLIDDDAISRFALDPARELYEGLSAEARLAVQTVAVHDTPVAVSALRFALPALDSAECVDRLVRDHVLGHEKGRLFLTPLDRDHALRQAIADGTLPTLHERAAEFYARLCRPLSQCQALSDLDPLLRRVRHLHEAGHPTAAAALLDELDARLLAWRQARVVLRLRIPLTDHLTDEEALLRHHSALGQARLQLQQAEAGEHLRIALDLARRLHDSTRIVHLLDLLALEAFENGELAAAAERHDEGLALASALGDHALQASHLAGLARLALERGDARLAVAHFEEAVTLAEGSGDQALQAATRAGLGSALKAAGERERSMVAFHAAHAPGDTLLGDGVTEVGSSTTLLVGIRCLSTGHLAEAERAFREARELSVRRLSSTAESAPVRFTLALAELALGHPEAALESWRQALSRSTRDALADEARAILHLLLQAAPELAGGERLLEPLIPTAVFPSSPTLARLTDPHGEREASRDELTAIRASGGRYDLIVDDTLGVVHERTLGEVSFANRRVLGRLLVHLLRHAGHDCSPQSLIRDVWNNPTFNADSDLRTVRVNVSRLRKLIEPDPDEPRYVLMRPARFGHPVAYLFNGAVSFCLIEQGRGHAG